MRQRQFHGCEADAGGAPPPGGAGGGATGGGGPTTGGEAMDSTGSGESWGSGLKEVFFQF